MNGFHDAANSIATVVSTRVLTPRAAVIWAAFFNFVAAFGFGVAVATTVGKGIVQPRWSTTPSSSPASAPRSCGTGSRGATGCRRARRTRSSPGWLAPAPRREASRLLVPAGLVKIAVFIVVSPIVGLVLGALFMVIALNVVRRATPATVDRVFRRLQLLSAAGYSLGHGTNDAQKTMGIIAVLLFSAGP